MDFPTKYDLIANLCDREGLWPKKDGEIAKAVNALPEAKDFVKQRKCKRVLASDVAGVKHSKIADAMQSGHLTPNEIAAHVPPLSEKDLQKHLKEIKKTVDELRTLVRDETDLYAGYWTPYHELQRLVRIASRQDGVLLS